MCFASVETEFSLETAGFQHLEAHGCDANKILRSHVTPCMAIRSEGSAEKFQSREQKNAPSSLRSNGIPSSAVDSRAAKLQVAVRKGINVIGGEQWG